MRTINLAAEPLEILAADTTTLPRFRGVAYTGGTMQIAGWGDVLVSIGGMETPERVAILADHQNELRAIAGSGRPQAENGRLLVEGELTAGTPAGEMIVNLAKSNVPLQMSIGARPTEFRHVKAGEKIVANGRTHVAGRNGLKFITRSRLGEITICALGADADTSVEIAAQHGRKEMSEGSQTIDLDSLKRIRTVLEFMDHVSDTLKAQWEEEFITGQITIEEVHKRGWEELQRATELEKIRGSRPKSFYRNGGPAIHDTSRLYSQPTDVLAASLMSRSGFASAAESQFGPQVMQESQRFRNASLVDIGKACLELSGQSSTLAGGVDNLLRAASVSNYSLPTVLGDTLNRVLQVTYMDTPATWRSFCATREVSDFRPHKSVRPNMLPNLQILAPNGSIKHGVLTEAGTITYQADTYAQVIGIDRKAVVNDDLQFLSELGPEQAKAAMRTLSDHIWTAILALTPNSTDTLTAGLGEAIATMLSARDDHNHNIDIRPKTLVTTPEYRTAAIEILESENIQKLATESGPTGNALRKSLALEIEPRMSNTANFGSNASATKWAVFADTSAVPVIVAFLRGQQMPTAEFFPVGHEADNLFAHWRIHFDFGVAAGDTKARYISSGA